MKKMVSMVLLLAMTIVPVFSAFGESAYGWEDSQFLVQDMQWVFALPEGAVLASEEDIDAENERAPFDLKEKIICMMTLPESDIQCTIGVKQFASPDDIPTYYLFYMFGMVDALQLDSMHTTMGDENFCGVDSCLIRYPQDGYATTVTIVPGGSDAYVVTVTVPESAEGARDAFIAQLTAPMAAE